MDDLDEPVEISYTISIGFAGANREGVFTIDRVTWDGLGPDGRRDLIEEMYQEEVAAVLDGGWDVKNANVDGPTLVEGD